MLNLFIVLVLGHLQGMPWILKLVQFLLFGNVSVEKIQNLLFDPIEIHPIMSRYRGEISKKKN